MPVVQRHAVRVMSRSCAVQSLLIAALLGSLAVAHAESGDFDDPFDNARDPVCKPYQLPDGSMSFQSFCDSLSQYSSIYFELLWREAPAPSKSDKFPLKGCTIGCVVGTGPAAQTARRPWNSGSWSGKCFRKDAPSTGPSEIVNILTPGQNLQDWSRGLDGLLAYPAPIFVDDSWADRKPAWTIDYKDSPAFGGRSISEFRDELREVAPGLVLGKTFIKAFSLPYNPTPVDAEAMLFALFQVCDKDGGYPDEPASRLIA